MKYVFPKPNILVSKCLGFAKCRWDGKVVKDEFVKMLEPYVNYVTVCPECAIGLGIPRKKIRIVLKNNSYRLVQLDTGKDLTEKMSAFAAGYVASLNNIDGFILKDRSPSCGIKNVKAYSGPRSLNPIKKTSGFFSKKILQAFPGAAIETETRLTNSVIRGNFLLKIFKAARFRTVFLIFVMLTALQASNAGAVSWESDLDSALARAQSSGDPLMVDFYTDWCHWCKKMDSDTYNDGKVNDLAGDFICVHVDAQNNPNVARKYGVRGYPTAIFMDCNGKVLQTVVGYRGPGDFAAIMEGVLKSAKSVKSQREAETSRGKPDLPAVKPAVRKTPRKVIDTEQAVQDLQRKLKKMQNSNLELEGIIYDKACPRAVINDKIVKVGDVVEGAKVLKIYRKSVVMSVKDKELTLKMD